MAKKASSTPYPKIGDETDPSNIIFCLLLEEWFDGLVRKTNCKKGGCSSDLVTTVNAFNYFITSGEAVKKAEQLNKDAWEFAGKCRALLAALKKARGSSMYLEISVEDGVLICRRKDPRKKNTEEESI